MRFLSTALFVVLLICSFSLTACQTPKHRSFERVQMGMDKESVLEAAGNPYSTHRYQGRDRWIYEFPYHSDGPQTREVHFLKGRVVYIGNKIPPPVTADQQDRINEESNAEEERQLRQSEEARAKVLGAVGPQTTTAKKTSATTQPAKSDPIDPRLQYYLYGTGSEHDPAVESRKRAPVFEPVR